jgi:hypothetical protein
VIQRAYGSKIHSRLEVIKKWDNSMTGCLYKSYLQEKVKPEKKDYSMKKQ